MDMIAEIRRRYHVSHEKISDIARSLEISRTTVRKHLDTVEEPAYKRAYQPAPKLGPFKDLLTDKLETDAKLPKKQRHTAMRLFSMHKVKTFAFQANRFISNATIRHGISLWKSHCLQY